MFIKKSFDRMYEEGFVSSIKGNWAEIELIQKKECVACGARSMCHISEEGSLKKKTILAFNTLNARVGDRVSISILKKSILKASFLVYIVPVLGLLLGAFGGRSLNINTFLSSQLNSIIIGLGCFFCSCFLIRTWIKKLSKKKEYSITVVDIL